MVKCELSALNALSQRVAASGWSKVPGTRPEGLNSEREWVHENTSRERESMSVNKQEGEREREREREMFLPPGIKRGSQPDLTQ